MITRPCWPKSGNTDRKLPRFQWTVRSFIIGINRTGCTGYTLLHRLPVQKPCFRALRGHELMPAAMAPGMSDIPKIRQRMYLEDALSATDLVRTLASLRDVGANESGEEFQLLNLAFASWACTIRCRVPACARWLGHQVCEPGLRPPSPDLASF